MAKTIKSTGIRLKAVIDTLNKNLIHLKYQQQHSLYPVDYAAVVDASGREYPITDEMINQAIEDLIKENSRKSKSPPPENPTIYNL